MEMLSSKQKIAIIIAGVVIVGIFIFYMSTKTKNNDYSVLKEEIVEEEETKEIKEEAPQEIIVHITGAVKNEGIVKLEEGARVIDAVEEAGGLIEDAYLENVNLAYKLKDGQKIYIPWIFDTEEEILEKNVVIDYGFEDDTSTSSKVNINTADVSQLMTLSGIGESTANKIIEYRKLNGKFKTIEDIKNVSGIGTAKYESIKDYICT